MLYSVAPSGYRQPAPHEVVAESARDLFRAIDQGQPLADAVRDIVAVWGFNSFSYSYATSPRVVSWQNRFAFSTLPPEWFEEYNRRDFIKTDLRLRDVVDSMVPLLWESKGARGKCPEVDAFLDFMTSFDVRSGFVVSLHDVNHCSIIASLGWPKASIDDVCRRAVNHVGGEIMLFVRSFHTFCMAPWIEERLPTDGPAEELTPGQRSVFALAAAGNDHDTIALQLGVSRSTVQRHLEQGRVRLGANNSLEAVTKALRAGQIVPPHKQIDLDH